MAQDFAVMVVGLKSSTKWLDHFVCELYSDPTLTTLVSSKTCAVEWNESEAKSVQKEAVVFDGLTDGDTYFLRVGSVAPFNGAVNWSKVCAVVAGSISGDGSGVSGPALAQGPVKAVQFKADEAGHFGGSAALRWFGDTEGLIVTTKVPVGTTPGTKSTVGITVTSDDDVPAKNRTGILIKPMAGGTVLQPEGEASAMITMTHGGPLSNWVWGAEWRDWMIPVLPADAVVTAIYAVMRGSANTTDANTGEGTVSGTTYNTWGASAMGGTLGGPTTTDGVEHTWHGTNLGTNINILLDRKMSARLWSNGGGDYSHYFNVTGVAYAIYYTSASATQEESSLAPPVALSAGQGIAWSYPQFVEAHSADEGATNGSVTATAFSTAVSGEGSGAPSTGTIIGLHIEDQTGLTGANDPLVGGKYALVLGSVNAEVAIIDRKTGEVVANFNGSYPLSAGAYTGPAITINGQGSYVGGARTGAIADNSENFWVFIQATDGTGDIYVTRIHITATTTYPTFTVTNYNISGYNAGTTVSELTAHNTSASASYNQATIPANFTGTSWVKTDGTTVSVDSSKMDDSMMPATPLNVSKEDVHTLFPSHPSVDIATHLTPWQGSGSHRSTGYSSHNAAQAAAQVADMISSGYDLFEVDWYGSVSWEDASLQLLQDAVQGTSLKFLVHMDWGMFANKGSLTNQQYFVQQLQYCDAQYFSDPNYYRTPDGKPVVLFFNFQSISGLDYVAAKDALGGNVCFIGQGTTEQSVSGISGCHDWIHARTTGVDNTDPFALNDLIWFAGNCLTGQYSVPNVAVGFNGTNTDSTSWSKGKDLPRGYDSSTSTRHDDSAECWLAQADALDSNMPSNVLFVRAGVWNDYEEGGSIEPGILSGVSISASLASSTLSWSISGYKASDMLSKYKVYVYDGTTLAWAGSVAIGTNSLDLSTIGLDSSKSYTAYVQAVGKPRVQNVTSSGVSISGVGGGTSGGDSELTNFDGSRIDSVVYVSEDNSALFSAGDRVNKFNLSSGTLSSTEYFVPPDAGTPHICSESDGIVLVWTDNHLYLLDADTMSLVSTFAQTDFGFSSSVHFREAVYDNNTQYVFAIMDDNNLYRLKLTDSSKSGALLGSLSSHSLICDSDRGKVLVRGGTKLQYVSIATGVAGTAYTSSVTQASGGFDPEGNYWFSDANSSYGFTKAYQADPDDSFAVLQSIGANTNTSSGFAVPRPGNFAFIDVVGEGNPGAYGIKVDAGVNDFGPGPNYSDGEQIVTTPEPVSLAANRLVLGNGGHSVVPGPVLTGDANDVLRGDGTSSPLPIVVVFGINDGTVGDDVTLPACSPRNGVLTKARVVVKESDPTTDLTFDVKKNGVSVFSSPRTVTHGTAGGTKISLTLVSNPLAVAQDDLFTINITAGGSTWKFVVQLET